MWRRIIREILMDYGADRECWEDIDSSHNEYKDNDRKERATKLYILFTNASLRRR